MFFVAQYLKILNSESKARWTNNMPQKSKIH